MRRVGSGYVDAIRFDGTKIWRPNESLGMVHGQEGGFLVHAVMAISSEDRKHFEEMDELYVRRAMHMTDRFPFPLENSAWEWLAERDEAQRPMREARRAKVAAEQFGRIQAAWIAAGAGVVTILVGILTWLFPLH
jgi:hypothetical protein